MLKCEPALPDNLESRPVASSTCATASISHGRYVGTNNRCGLGEYLRFINVYSLDRDLGSHSPHLHLIMIAIRP